MGYQINGKGYIVAVDQPAADAVIGTPSVHITGWVATTLGPPRGVGIMDRSGAAMPARLFERADVMGVLPGYHVSGFELLVPTLRLLGADRVHLRFTLDDGAVEVPLHIGLDATALEAVRADVPRRRAAIERVLACPRGCHDALQFKPSMISCPTCHGSWPRPDGRFDMRDEELRRAIDNGPVAAVSSNGYDPLAWSIINKHPKGLILDNGAGLRDRFLPNVINLEICDLPTTDVLGVGERLPFRDNSFDAVFSLAVLEHVRNPFACAREIARVLKPGGTLYAAVPFLQPFHGYPDHYYNMTSHGLLNLFGKHLRIEEHGVPKSGKPFWALNWILRSYVNGLPAEVADRFKNMTVADLLGDPLPHLEREYVTALSAAADEELACVNYILATKA
jgi:hypothetical protein